MSAAPIPASRVRALESVRGAAALYVFLHHYGHDVLARQHPWTAKFFPFGQLAVLTFFVTSGFVIHLATFAKPTPPPFRTFLLQRIRRIYPPFLIAVGVGFLDLYAHHESVNWVELLGNLFMLQNERTPGNFFHAFAGNGPLWSLSFEWWFYLMLYPTWWLSRRSGAPAFLVALAFSLAGHLTQFLFPNPLSVFASYYVIWWAGVELAREYAASGTVTFGRQLLPIASVVLCTGLWAARLPLGHHRIDWYEYPAIQMRHGMTALGVILVGLAWVAFKGAGFRQVFGQFERFSPISYGLYVIHLPIIYLLAKGPAPLSFLWTAPAVLFAAWLIELQIQPWINRTFPIGSATRKAESVAAPVAG